MFNASDPYGLRAYNAAKRRQNEVDRAARAIRLNSAAVAAWTKLVGWAGRIAKAGITPCDYRPWERVLNELSRDPAFVGPFALRPKVLSKDLMAFSSDLAQPGWCEPRPDLIEFALTFLEADVMLFRSGYVKRHLLKRLQQSNLTASHIDRVHVLLRRAIVRGSSVEEFRAYRKLAGHLCQHTDTTGLITWLEGMAEGAIVTLDRVDGKLYAEFFLSSALSEQDRKLLASYSTSARSEWGLVFPQMVHIVQTGGALSDPRQRTAVRAFLMLETIRRRREGHTISSGN